MIQQIQVGTDEHRELHTASGDMARQALMMYLDRETRELNKQLIQETAPESIYRKQGAIQALQVVMEAIKPPYRGPSQQ